MSSLLQGLSLAKGNGQHDVANSVWWTDADCPNCGKAQFLIVASEGEHLNTLAAAPTPVLMYLRCARCRIGLVVNGGIASPAGQPLRVVRGAGVLIETAWAEVRAVLSVRAWTAAVMLCRKIILHVAVAHDLPEKDRSGRSPSFQQAVKHLAEVGLITPPMKPWVDHIRTVGNGANHDLDEISQDSALRVATFTEQLLILVYEMPAVMAAAFPSVEEAPAVVVEEG